MAPYTFYGGCIGFYASCVKSFLTPVRCNCVVVDECASSRQPKSLSRIWCRKKPIISILFEKIGYCL